MPEKHVGFVILSNSEFYSQAQLMAPAMLLFDHYLGLPKNDWNAVILAQEKEARAKEKAAQDEAIAKRVSGTHPSVKLEKYVGKYRNEIYGDIDIGLNAGALSFTFGPQRVAELSHWNYDTFKLNWKNLLLVGKISMVTFNLDSRGLVQQLALDNDVVFTREQG